MMTILKYEWLLFRRNTAMQLSWVILLATGLYSIYYGHTFNKAQLNTINTLDTAYQNRVKLQVSQFSADTATKEGKSAYKNVTDPFMSEYGTRAVIWKNPLPLQALSIGQSDNQPFFYNVWIRDNVYTTKSGELRNPDKLLAGNFDLSFVLIYLLPLLIIALNYGLLSDDREAGISKLTAAHGISDHQLVSGKILFRFLIVTLLAVILSICGFMYNGVNAIGIFAEWTTAGLLYILFWFALCYIIVSLRKSSAVNALALISCWIALILMIPSAVNNSIEIKDPARVTLSDASREFSEHLWQKWQSGSSALPDTLFSVKPDWRALNTKDTETVRSMGYYYLNFMHLKAIGSTYDSVASREQADAGKWNIINPGYVAQSYYNRLAGTESSSYISFRSAAADYQQQRIEKFAELNLKEKRITPDDYRSYPVFTEPMSKGGLNLWFTSLWYLLVWIILFSVTGYQFLNRSINQ